MAVRASQFPLEVIGYSTSHVRATQLVAENIIYASSILRASQLVLEVQATPTSSVRCSQLVLEAFVTRYPIPSMPIFPNPGTPSQSGGEPVETLLNSGLGYNVVRRPIFTTGVGTAQSGREVRIQYWPFNLWQWDLDYPYLPSSMAQGITNSDFHTLLGFFLETASGLLPFLYQDPDDYQAVNAVQATTDGSQRIFTLYRPLGASVEPVGFVNVAKPLLIYLDGILLDPDSAVYTFIGNDYGNQIIRFAAAPTSDQVLTATFDFYYVCRFLHDTQDLEEFVDLFWETKKLTLQSLRAI